MKKIILLTIFTLLAIKCFYPKAMTITISKIEKTKLISELKWWCLQQAFIHVESKGNDSALGSKQDVGCLQITPIYLKEANRLCNDSIKFKLSDRYNRKKSIIMFDIVQNHYNPKQDIFKAIYLHNPGANHKYKDSILANYKQLLNKYKIKNNV